MKKEYRVKKNHEFSSIIGKRKQVQTPAFVLYMQPCKLDHARVGISVSKKLGNAVVRNKIKRQIRSIIDQIYDFNEPFDTILIVRPAYPKFTREELLEMLKHAREKAGSKCPRGDKK